MNGGTFTGGNGGSGGNGLSASATNATGGSVTVNGGTFKGGEGGSGASGGSGGEGLRVTGGTLLVSDGTFTGGMGGDSGAAGDGGSGLYVGGGTCSISGGAFTGGTGGDGGNGLYVGGTCSISGGTFIRGNGGVGDTTGAFGKAISAMDIPALIDDGYAAYDNATPPAVIADSALETVRYIKIAIVLPELSVDGTNIFANGKAITLKAGTDTTKTNIFYNDDLNTPLNLDTISGTDITGDTTNGYDLSAYRIYGGKESGSLSGGTSVTMEGGEVYHLYGGGKNCVVGGGNISVTISGGKVTGDIFGNGYQCNSTIGDIKVTISGDAEVSENVYGDGSECEGTIQSIEVSISGQAKVSRNVYGGGSRCTGTIGSTAVNISGAPKIGGNSVHGGGTSSFGIVINGGTEPVENGVDSFNIVGELTEDAAIQVLLPTGCPSGVLAKGVDYPITESDMGKLTLHFDDTTASVPFIPARSDYLNQIVAAFPVGVSENENKVTAFLGADGSTLTIMGDGAMKDFTNSTDVPWNASNGAITDVMVTKGVTHVGSNSFTDCGNLETATLRFTDGKPKTIGEDVFPAGFAASNITVAVSTVSGKVFSGWTSTTESGTAATFDKAGEKDATLNVIPVNAAITAGYTVSSSGGGISITIPVTGSGTTVETEVTTSGSTVTVKEPAKENLDKALAAAAGDKKPLELDLSSLKDTLKNVTLPPKTLAAAAQSAVSGGVTGLTVKLPNGNAVTFDAKALSSLPTDDSLTLSIDERPGAKLSAEESALLGEKATAIIFDLALRDSMGKVVSDFSGGVATVVLRGVKMPGNLSDYALFHKSGDKLLPQTFTRTATETPGVYDLTMDNTGWSSYLMSYEAGKNPFTDVAEDAYYYDAVLWAVNEGITEGTAPAAFSPDLACTRAQAITFLWRAMGSPEPKATASPFADVRADGYYHKAVLWATEQGITVGTSATTFSPDQTVIRSQIAAFLWRTAGKNAATGANPFADVASDAYYADAVRWAVAEKITEGTGKTTFSPEKPCSRAQIVTFLYRYLSKRGKT